MSYLHPHQPSWKEDFNHERDLILSRFDQDLELHHIGSTAIDGLYAKDCIDILGVITDLRKVTANGQCLTDLGYVYIGEYGIPGRAYFSKTKRKVHLHVFEHGHDQIKKHLGFVRFMQSNDAYIAQLNQLKIKLHARFSDDKESYQVHKKYFYDKIHHLYGQTQQD